MEFTKEAREVLLRVTLAQEETDDEPGTWEAVAAVRADPGEEDPALTLSGVARGDNISRPSTQALEALLAGIRRVWPEQSYPLPLVVEVVCPYGETELARLLAESLALVLDDREWSVQRENQGS